MVFVLLLARSHLPLPPRMAMSTGSVFNFLVAVVVADIVIAFYCK